MHPTEVDRRARRRLVAAHLLEQPRLHLRVAQLRRLFPQEPRLLGATDVRAHGPVPDAHRALDLPLAQTPFVLQPQNFSHLSHRMALRHATSHAPWGLREAPFRHDHPRVPAPTSAPRDPPATRPPSWPA